MKTFLFKGEALRATAKALVIEYMTQNSGCQPDGSGVKQTDIFRDCGFDWGAQDKSTSSNQQYWLIALLRVLESEGVIEQVEESGPWRLKKETNRVRS
jgi:hypothetical protein